MTSTYADRIQGVATSVAVKAPVRVATVTANTTQSGLQTIDGVTVVAGDRILDWTQTTDDTKNGIWVAATGAWARAEDMNGSRDVADGTSVVVAEGTRYGRHEFVLTTSDPVIGTSSLVFKQKITVTNGRYAQEVTDLNTSVGLHGNRLDDLEADVDALTAAQAGVTIQTATWADLLALTGTVEGQGASVLDSDSGTHSQATATGYDGSSVNNAGVYSWNATWGRWLRIGDNGLSGKAEHESRWTQKGEVTTDDAANAALVMYSRGNVYPGSRGGFFSQPSLLLRRSLMAPNLADETYLYLEDGQSLAGTVYGGGRLAGIGNRFGRVEMPNDILGVPGSQDGTTNYGDALPTTGIHGFVPADDRVNPDPPAGGTAPRPLQSVAIPAAATLLRLMEDDLPHVVVRTVGANGQPFVENYGGGGDTGLHLQSDLVTKTVIYDRKITAITEMINRASALGRPVTKIFICFHHGQEEQTDTAAVYQAKLEAYIDDTDASIAAVDSTIDIYWLLSQNGGNTTRSDREPRKAIFDTAQSVGYEHVYYSGTEYPYPLTDSVHWTNKAKVMFGELEGACAHAILRGRPWTVPTVAAAGSGSDILCTVTADHDFEIQEMFTTGEAYKGFTISGGSQTITGHTITDINTFTLHLDSALAGGEVLRHAYRNLVGAESATSGFARGQGSLRERWRMESHFYAGEGIYRYYPGFEETIT